MCILLLLLNNAFLTGTHILTFELGLYFSSLLLPQLLYATKRITLLVHLWVWCSWVVIPDLSVAGSSPRSPTLFSRRGGMFVVL